jgi:hypothetical protein
MGPVVRPRIIVNFSDYYRLNKALFLIYQTGNKSWLDPRRAPIVADKMSSQELGVSFVRLQIYALRTQLCLETTATRTPSSAVEREIPEIPISCLLKVIRSIRVGFNSFCRYLFEMHLLRFGVDYVAHKAGNLVLIPWRNFVGGLWEYFMFKISLQLRVCARPRLLCMSLCASCLPEL